MEIRVLKYFLTVAREENITKAAEILHITQPTLSRQLMQLEDELGTKLFKRGKHNVYLTEDGMLLKKRAQDIVTLADRAEREFKERQEEIAGEIIFGSAETMGVYELAKIIAKFRKEYPLVQYEMYTAIADDIKERMDKGIIDIGLLTEPVDISKYNFMRLNRKERWGILVKNDSELAKKEYVTPKDLVNVPLLMTKREIVRNELSNWFGEYYDNLRIVGTYNLLNNAAVMVENEIGAALCFKISHEYENLKFIPFSPTLETGCVLVWQKNRQLSKSASVFLDIAKKYIKGIS